MCVCVCVKGGREPGEDVFESSSGLMCVIWMAGGAGGADNETYSLCLPLRSLLITHQRGAFTAPLTRANGSYRTHARNHGYLFFLGDTRITTATRFPSLRPRPSLYPLVPKSISLCASIALCFHPGFSCVIVFIIVPPGPLSFHPAHFSAHQSRMRRVGPE